MVRNIILTEENVEAVDEVIDLIYAKIGIRLNTKELVNEIFQNPKALSEVVITNFRKKVAI